MTVTYGTKTLNLTKDQIPGQTPKLSEDVSLGEVVFRNVLILSAKQVITFRSFFRLFEIVLTALLYYIQEHQEVIEIVNSSIYTGFG